MDSFIDLKKRAEKEKETNSEKILNKKVCVFDKNDEELNSDLIGKLSRVKLLIGKLIIFINCIWKFVFDSSFNLIRN